MIEAKRNFPMQLGDANVIYLDCIGTDSLFWNIDQLFIKAYHAGGYWIYLPTKTVQFPIMVETCDLDEVALSFLEII